MSKSLTAVQLIESNMSMFTTYLQPTLPKQLVEVEQRLGLKFPEEYRHFLLTWNGGDFENVRLRLFGWAEVDDFNPEPDWSKNLPGMIFFGNDEGDDIFYFDPENQLGKGAWAIYSCSMGAACFEDSSYVAENFTHLIQRALTEDSLTDGPRLKDEASFMPG